MKQKLYKPKGRMFLTERLPLEVRVGTGCEYESEWNFRSYNMRGIYLILLRHIDCGNIVKEEHFTVDGRIIMRKFLLGFLYGRPYYDEHKICSTVDYNSDAVRYVTCTHALYRRDQRNDFSPFEIDSVLETLKLDDTWKEEIEDHIARCMRQINLEE